MNRAVRVNEQNEVVTADGLVIGKVVPRILTKGIENAMAEIQDAGENPDNAFTMGAAWVHLIYASPVDLTDAVIEFPARAPT